MFWVRWDLSDSCLSQQDPGERSHRFRLLPQRLDAFPKAVGQTEVQEPNPLQPHAAWGALCRHGGTPADGQGHPGVHQDCPEKD